MGQFIRPWGWKIKGEPMMKLREVPMKKLRRKGYLLSLLQAKHQSMQEEKGNLNPFLTQSRRCLEGEKRVTKPDSPQHKANPY